jgi:hypothetical protein
MKFQAATRQIAFTVGIAIIGYVFAATAYAQEAAPAAAPMSQHPAVLLQRDVFLLKQGRIDPQTFIVAHPARLALVGGHANQEHPALAVARQAQSAQIDINAYRVQPPAATTWRLASEADATVVAAVPAAAAR